MFSTTSWEASVLFDNVEAPQSLLSSCTQVGMGGCIFKLSNE